LEHLYGHGGSQPSLPELEHVLGQIFHDFNDVFIIVDALDECSEHLLLSEWIKNVAIQGTGNLHFLATCRPEQDIYLTEVECTYVHMECSIVSLDIVTYVHNSIAGDRRLRRMLDKDLIQQLVANADGM